MNVNVSHDCYGCDHNGAFDKDTGDYTYDKEIIKTKNLKRDQVSYDSECELGPTYGCGCHHIKCAKCGLQAAYIYFVD